MEATHGLTRELARYAVSTRYDLLPQEVRHEAVRAFLNWIGVAVGGCQEDAVSAAAACQADTGAKPVATVIGKALHTDVAGAAFVNCIASSVLAFDDAHLPSVAHPSGPAAAALFAVAQSRSVGGEAFLSALALSIEVQCRVANMLVLPPSTFSPNIYVNGFSGPIGVAVGAGRLLELDEQKMIWAIGLAASQASGFRATGGTMTGHFRPGHAARTGVWAALLADKGFDCTDDALEARGGLLDIFAKGADTDFFLSDLGARHEMLRNRYKPYPCGIVIHPVIDACLDIYQQLPAAGEIRHVRLKVNPAVLALTGKREPKTTLESHVSVYHWAACALQKGKAGLAETEIACLRDPAIQALGNRVEAQSDRAIAKEQAIATVILDDGTTIESHVRNARGSGDRPMTDDELNAKFDELTRRLLVPERSKELREACWHIAAAENVGARIGALLP
ncbi:MmgE/PrpD family protein [Novosphingobium album (ex Liu et al. 2023)]|uniref:MmgE/PrpD family protein n=1 Tax=Novosphingobium album (ex Liu et al. 2023) TaxID=3031130 RepID=A0ABT5WQX5_9SPHN|nr:MmgE/PrpD family protein [Novosphingobium album (ex Liu et al. 2023)]MDE8652434.1 MmgE/PrpD family protein [Novosphingobium album (ex Liu et al. 2023)]